MDFGAGTAWSRLAHRPEIIFFAEAEDATVLQLRRDLLPQVESFVVVMIDCRIKAFRLEPQVLAQEFPGELDGILFEIITKREIAQHLEESMMPCRLAHVFEIIVLAAGSHTLLRSGSTLVINLALPQEDILELVHPGIGKEQGRIIMRDQR